VFEIYYKETRNRILGGSWNGL